jgi:hypothetical protein
VSLAITLSQKSYLGTGFQTAFPTGFAFLDNSHLTVEVASPGSAYVTQVLGVDYNVTGAGAAEPGGTVTFLVAPFVNYAVRITRNTPRTQTKDFTNEFEFLPETHEEAHDEREMQIQELERRVAELEAGQSEVSLDASKVTDTFVVSEPVEDSFPRNVACAGTPSMVLIGRVEDLTDPALSQYGLGLPDISAVALNQFTVRHVPGLTPGHNTRITYLVLTL